MFEKWKYPWNKRKDSDDPGAEEEVYAGPEYFEKNQAPMECVYAGPAFYNKQPNPMACVYAGPEYFDQNRQGDGMNLMFGTENQTAGEQPEVIDGVLCPACGFKAERQFKFCHNCGVPLPKEEG